MDFWTSYWGFVSFVFGAVVGSFLNVCIWRLPRGESLAHPPSHCPNCDHRLYFWPDMVPLLSQLWYRSRCHYCKTPFSWRYFWVELFTAVTFTAVYARYSVFGAPELGPNERLVSTLCGMFFVAALIAIFFIDLETYSIANSTVVVAVAAAVTKDLFLIWSGAPGRLWHEIPGTSMSVPVPISILGGLMAFWFLWQFAALGTAALGKEAMGAGDAYLLGAMGAFLVPWPLVVVAFLCSVALGTVGGLTNLALAYFRPRAPEPDVVEEADGAAQTPDEGAPEAAPPEPQGVASVENGAFAEAPAAEQWTEPSQQNAGDEPVGAAMPRGAVGLPDHAGTEPEMPECPAASRWGRLWTVVGTWFVLGSLWGGAILFESSRMAGLCAGAAGLAVAAGLLWYGIRLWVAGDGVFEEQGWNAEMDEYFAHDPGPRAIPFGPYLVAGTLIAMLFGHQIVAWYVTSPWGLSMSLQELSRLPWD